jgi:putative redox protein
LSPPQEKGEGVRRAVARRRSGYTHDVEIRGHSLVSDETEDKGGDDRGPKSTELLAAALASCTAITVEMYAERKDWELGEVEAEVEMSGSSGEGVSFDVVLRIPVQLEPEQQDRLLTIAGKCPVHRMLAAETDVEVSDRIECQS